jgi:hypothetical protein
MGAIWVFPAERVGSLIYNGPKSLLRVDVCLCRLLTAYHHLISVRLNISELNLKPLPDPRPIIIKDQRRRRNKNTSGPENTNPPTIPQLIK